MKLINKFNISIFKIYYDNYLCIMNPSYFGQSKMIELLNGFTNYFTSYDDNNHISTYDDYNHISKRLFIVSKLKQSFGEIQRINGRIKNEIRDAGNF